MEKFKCVRQKEKNDETRKKERGMQIISGQITMLILYNYYSNKMHTFFIIKITRYYNL
jgi:hypothetical protein